LLLPVFDELLDEGELLELDFDGLLLAPVLGVLDDFVLLPVDGVGVVDLEVVPAEVPTLDGDPEDLEAPPLLVVDDLGAPPAPAVLDDVDPDCVDELLEVELLVLELF
jgi:hypothetical protein